MLTRPITEPDFGPSSNYTLKRTNTNITKKKEIQTKKYGLRRIQISVNHKFYFDNYYTALPLILDLANTVIYRLVTVRKNRIPGCKLPDEKSLKVLDRGSSFEYTTTLDGIDIPSLVCKDKKFVTILFTFAGTNPVKKVNLFES